MIILREQKKNIKGEDVSGIPAFEREDIGFAVDLGTTTIELAAVDLESGRVVGRLSETNIQTKLGADVMMRIMHSLAGKQEELHRMAVSQIERMARCILGGAVDKGNFNSSRCVFAVVGNTAMCHLFLNQDVSGLAGYPFKPNYTGNYHCRGKEIGMDFFCDAEVFVLSGIAAHVGSDALAVIGVENLFRRDRIQLAVDLGTNAEIILNKMGQISVCSAAAGPAFEGRGIQCGMPAKQGAVNGIKMSSANGSIILEFIGGGMPVGICGSGLVDAIAGLRKCRVLRADGYLLSSCEAVKQKIHPEICKQLVVRNGQNAFLFYQNEERGKEIYLQQSDIRGIQLAKGAVYAGMQCLLSKNSLKLLEVDEIVIAGVLGSCIRPANAVAIGLLPDAAQKFCLAKNAAGRGAVHILTDKNFLKDMEQLARTIYHVELAQLADFQKLLIQAMELTPMPD